MEEIWKDIPSTNHYKYQVSNLGRVRSLPKTITYSDGRVYKYKSKVLVPKVNNAGYLHLNLFYDKGKSVTWDIQRLVAIAFIPNPNSKRVVNHINGDKLDNRAVNLEWNTYQENTNHAFESGLSSRDTILRAQKISMLRFKKQSA